MSTGSAPHPPASLMVWSVTDQVIEDRAVRLAQFQDLCDAGFGGLAAFVRCSRYSWDDPPAQAALRDISTLCRTRGLTFWFGPDPRFVSHRLVHDGSGLELLLFGDASRAAAWPNTTRIAAGRFSVRCMLPPRHVHTLNAVAVEFTPIAVTKVYAIRVRGSSVAIENPVDITRYARLFYNARDRYVEAFGSAPLPDGDDWHAVAFFHVRTNHADFSNDVHLRRYEALLARLKQSGCRLQGIMWDEPGYTCTYGSLPYSAAIRQRYHRTAGRSLEQDLWKLAFDAADRSHITVRTAYYREVQSTITRAQRRLGGMTRRLWGSRTAVGIHDTWHFESGEMCDMNHGSLDLWQTAQMKTGGFVDLGAVDRLSDPASPWYANLAAMAVTAVSLARLASNRVAYNNLWTTGDDGGKGGQRNAMEHCVKTMALFGTRWLAHAYGPAGTIGQERMFLGSPPLPGYPDHSTWKEFPAWNQFLAAELLKLEDRLPDSNLLLVFPVDTLYALGDARADETAGRVFSLILSLLDRHYHVDLLSPSSLRGGVWRNGRFVSTTGRYESMIIPFPAVMPADLRELLSRGRDQVLYLFQSPGFGNKPFPVDGPAVVATTKELFSILESRRSLRPVGAPDQTWVTMTKGRGGMIVSLAPSRCGKTYAGEVSYGGKRILVGPTGTVTRMYFPLIGEPALL